MSRRRYYSLERSGLALSASGTLYLLELIRFSWRAVSNPPDFVDGILSELNKRLFTLPCALRFMRGFFIVMVGYVMHQKASQFHHDWIVLRRAEILRKFLQCCTERNQKVG